jgi:hypothetical protein
VRMKVGAEIGMEVVVEVGVAFSGKSWTLKGASYSC